MKNRGMKIFAASAIAGSILAGPVAQALWSDSDEASVNVVAPSIEIDVTINGKQEYDRQPTQFGSQYPIRTSDHLSERLFRLWDDKESLSELAENHKFYHTVEIEARTFGLTGIEGSDWIEVIAQSEYRDYDGFLKDSTANVYKVNSAEECAEGVSEVGDVDKEGDQKKVASGGSDTYANSSSKSYFCIETTLPDKIGESGEHTNTVTVTGSNEVDGEVVEDQDSWTGRVELADTVYTPEMVDAQLEEVKGSDISDSRVRFNGVPVYIGENPEIWVSHSDVPARVE